MTLKRIKVRALDYHRNGVGGAPFYVALFREGEDAHPDDDGCKVAVVFAEPWHTTVLDVAKLAAGDIRFGSNSWRGDEYEPYLRRAIDKHNQERTEP
jgi:hypothetical protein